MTKRRRSKHVADGDRFSILQDDLTICYICGRKPVELHECIPGTAGRQKSKDNGLVIALCPECHRRVHEHDPQLMRMIKAHAQWCFENTHSREEWMAIFHRNYLDG